MDFQYQITENTNYVINHIYVHTNKQNLYLQYQYSIILLLFTVFSA